VLVEERILGLTVNLAGGFNDNLSYVLDAQPSISDRNHEDVKGNHAAASSGSIINSDGDDVLDYNQGRAHQMERQREEGSNMGKQNSEQNEARNSHGSEEDSEESGREINSELKELLVYMIEAVERSAPIIKMPVHIPRETVIDLSLLPQIIGDDDSFPTNRTSRVEVKIDDYLIEEAEFVVSKMRQEELKDAAESLKNEADLAAQNDRIRKIQMQERKARMEAELKAHKKDEASVRFTRKT
jgi:hypothetical protein